MEKEIAVIYTPKAKKSISKIAAYIHDKGYPETAIKFTERLYDFGDSLNIFPNKYPLCRQPQFAKRSMHCAVFLKDYVFVYKVVKNHLYVYNIIHTNTNPTFYSA